MPIHLTSLYITSEVLFWTKVHLKLLPEVICSEVQKWIQKNALIITTCSKNLSSTAQEVILSNAARHGKQILLDLPKLPTWSCSSLLPLVLVLPTVLQLCSSWSTQFCHKHHSKQCTSAFCYYLGCLLLFWGFCCWVFFNLKTLYSTLTPANCSFP